MDVPELTVGMKVHYDDKFYKQNGIIKSFNHNRLVVYVVYKCKNEWSRYEEFTGEATSIYDLKPGWL